MKKYTISIKRYFWIVTYHWSVYYLIEIYDFKLETELTQGKVFVGSLSRWQMNENMS